MMRREFKKLLMKIIVGMAVLSIFIFAYFAGQREKNVERDAERPIKAALRVRIDNGEAVILIDKQTQMRAGIAISSIENNVPPLSSTVWLNGKRWVYVEQEPETFVRKEISQVKPDDRLVVTGAGLLLSEEFREEVRIQE